METLLMNKSIIATLTAATGLVVAVIVAFLGCGLRHRVVCAAGEDPSLASHTRERRHGGCRTGAAPRVALRVGQRSLRAGRGGATAFAAGASRLAGGLPAGAPRRQG